MRFLPIVLGRKLLLSQLHCVGQLSNLGLVRPIGQAEVAICQASEAQDDQVLQLNRQAHGAWMIHPSPELPHGWATNAFPRCTLHEVLWPAVI